MYASGARLLVVSMLIAVTVRPAASDSCPEVDLDERGNCPPKRQPERKPGTPPAAKQTQLDIRGADITDARVSLDGQSVGRAPLTLETAPGRHLVEVTKDGYTPYSEWVEVKQGERKPVPVKLQPKTGPAAAQPVQPKVGSCPAAMVPVPAGTFQMGSLDGVGDADEHPQHEVTLSAYCIDKTEVPVKAYAACVAAKGCSAALRTVSWSGASADDVKRYSQFCNGDDRANHPINCVDWNQATAYCTWVGKQAGGKTRLPSEAEWEYAARGKDGRVYPWGNEAPSAKRLNACGSECVAMAKRDLKLDWAAMYNASDGWETTAPVGSFPDGASPFGALDMTGNVWEWTADWYGDYTKGAATNPRGAKTGSARVLRGGGWLNNDAANVRAAFRSRDVASNRNNNVGFRCARGD